MNDSFQEQAFEERERLLQKFENSFPESYLKYFEQCKSPFRNDVNKLISETKTEAEKYLKSLKGWRWKTALHLGALVAGGALVSSAPIAIGAVILDACLAAGAAAAGAGAGAGAGVGLGLGLRNLFWTEQPKPEENCNETGNEKGDEELAFTKYENGVIHVMLCFGTIDIKLESRKMKF